MKQGSPLSTGSPTRSMATLWPQCDLFAWGVRLGMGQILGRAKVRFGHRTSGRILPNLAVVRESSPRSLARSPALAVLAAHSIGSLATTSRSHSRSLAKHYKLNPFTELEKKLLPPCAHLLVAIHPICCRLVLVFVQRTKSNTASQCCVVAYAKMDAWRTGLAGWLAFRGRVSPEIDKDRTKLNCIALHGMNVFAHTRTDGRAQPRTRNSSRRQHGGRASAPPETCMSSTSWLAGL